MSGDDEPIDHIMCYLAVTARERAERRAAEWHKMPSIRAAIRRSHEAAMAAKIRAAAPDVSGYVSDRVFDGVRPLSESDAARVRSRLLKD
jgi:hypothetical protein